MNKITNQDRVYVARNLVHYRKIKGWTQEQLAFEAHTTNKCISDLELAKRNVKLDTISKVAKALDVQLSDLTKINELLPNYIISDLLKVVIFLLQNV